MKLDLNPMQTKLLADIDAQIVKSEELLLMHLAAVRASAQKSRRLWRSGVLQAAIGVFQVGYVIYLATHDSGASRWFVLSLLGAFFAAGMAGHLLTRSAMAIDPTEADAGQLAVTTISLLNTRHNMIARAIETTGAAQ